MKKTPAWLIIVLVFALLFAGKILFFPKKTETGKSTAKAKAGPVAVNYFVVSHSQLNNDVFATGKIGAINQVDVLPEVAGKVQSIHFKEGETVQKGSLLVKLNDADLQAQQLKIKTQLKLSEQKLERLKKLLTINGISQEEHDMQENELMSLKADQAYISAQLDKTSIHAPFTGVAGLKDISEGSFVNASTPIVSLVQMKPLYIEFSVPEKYNGIFRRGNTISFTSEGVSGSQTYSASIYAIEPRVDETTKTIKARALYAGEKEFYPGSFVKVLVNLGTTENVMMVPTQAVIATLKGQKVFVSKAGLAVEVPVEIGVRTDRSLQVTKGLQPGDTIITTGLLSLKNNSEVKLIKAQN